MPEFLDLTHRYMAICADDGDKVRQLNQLLIGPPRITRPSTIDPQAGFTPPAWWKGDEYASRSALVAMTTLRKQV